MSIIQNHERLVRFFHANETMAFGQDLKPMGALYVKDNQVLVCVDNEVTDEQFIGCLEALVKEYKKNPKNI
jgi:hypothetical protein